MAKPKSRIKKKKNQKYPKGVLLIVESPAKAETIKKYLGKGYYVEASMGHLIDLPKSRLGIETTSNFEPEYITVRGKATILKNLQNKASKVKQVLLASDPDREGEAISFHIMNALRSKNPNIDISRIIFNEITPDAIRAAVQKPLSLNEAKINAQKARRVLDRLVGYNLSPLLWSKVKNGLSAGRVQSVVLRMVCERDRKVKAFVPQEYWSIEAYLISGRSKFVASLIEFRGAKPNLNNKEVVDLALKDIETSSPEVESLKESKKEIRPRAPFSTSTLQQTAANRLGFTSRKTMQIAQQLYQGIDLGTERVGLITYMRTDSLRLSDSAIKEVRNFIQKNYTDCLPVKPIRYDSKGRSQDAHEAVRPTFVAKKPKDLEEFLSKDQFRLYSIIWERFVECHMLPQQLQTLTIDIKFGQGIFRASSTHSVFDGFQAVLKILSTKEKRVKLPKLKSNDKLLCDRLEPEQHFTTGPAQYTDASIVKMLEEKGIGRPATYAPIISTLLDRYYVVRRKRNLIPTTLGEITNNILTQCFPDVVNVKFTAEMEEMLDAVEEDRQLWVGMITDFYKPFKDHVEHINATLESVKGIMDEPTNEKCEKCKRPLIKKLGKYGFFVACTGFPECRFTKPAPLAKCPRSDCKGDVVVRAGQRRGREFYGCTKYPECDFVTFDRPTEQICTCGWFLVEREDSVNGALRVCINESCQLSGSLKESLNSNIDITNTIQSRSNKLPVMANNEKR